MTTQFLKNNVGRFSLRSNPLWRVATEAKGLGSCRIRVEQQLNDFRGTPVLGSDMQGKAATHLRFHLGSLWGQLEKGFNNIGRHVALTGEMERKPPLGLSLCENTFGIRPVQKSKRIC